MFENYGWRRVRDELRRPPSSDGSGRSGFEYSTATLTRRPLKHRTTSPACDESFNPPNTPPTYDNAKAESLMKAMKVEAVYPLSYETFEDREPSAAHRRGLQKASVHSPLGYPSPQQFENHHTW